MGAGLSCAEPRPTTTRRRIWASRTGGAGGRSNRERLWRLLEFLQVAQREGPYCLALALWAPPGTLARPEERRDGDRLSSRRGRLHQGQRRDSADGHRGRNRPVAASYQPTGPGYPSGCPGPSSYPRAIWLTWGMRWPPSGGMMPAGKGNEKRRHRVMRMFVLVEPKFFAPPEVFPALMEGFAAWRDAHRERMEAGSVWRPSSSSLEAAGASASSTCPTRRP